MAAQDQRRAFFEANYTFRGRRSEKLVKEPGSIEGQPFDLSDLHDCEVQLLDYTDQVQIDNVNASRVLVAASSESVFLRDCSDSQFTIACKQLRTRDCHNCSFFIYSRTEPIIELSDGLHFAPFNAAYHQHQEHLLKAGLDPEDNRWDRVYDFNDEAKTQVHWKSWDEAQEGPLEIWYPLGEICPVAVASRPSDASTRSGLDGMQTFSVASMRADAVSSCAGAPSSAGHGPDRMLLINNGGGNGNGRTEKKIKKVLVGWSEDRLGGGSIDHVAARSQAPVQQEAVEEDNRMSTAGELKVELQAMLLYAQQRGINLSLWFGGDEGEAVSVLSVDAFKRRLQGLSLGLCVGVSDVQRDIERAMSPTSIARAVELTRDGEGVNVGRLLELVSRLPSRTVKAKVRDTSCGVASPPKLESKQLRPRRNLEQLERLVAAVENKLRQHLRKPHLLHALKVRLGESSEPIVAKTLRECLGAAGLQLRKIEVETLMWRIRSYVDKSVANGVPLRMRKAEVMAYVGAMSRPDKPMKFDEWVAATRSAASARKQQVAAEFKHQALQGKAHRLSVQELSRCISEVAHRVIPADFLAVEVEGRAYEAASTDTGAAQNSLSFQSRLEDEKARLMEAETKAKAVSRNVLEKYLTSCSTKKFEGTLPLQAWLERRAADWTQKRQLFREWLRAKTAAVAQEQKEKASRAAALVEAQAASGLPPDTAADIIMQFAKVLGKPHPHVEQANLNLNLHSPLGECFENVLRQLEKAGAGGSRGRAAAASKQLDVAESATNIVSTANEALQRSQQKATDTYNTWKSSKAKIISARKREEKMQQEKEKDRKHEQKRAARAAFRRWLRGLKRNKYFSKKEGTLKDRPRSTSSTNIEQGREPWVDLIV